MRIGSGPSGQLSNNHKWTVKLIVEETLFKVIVDLFICIKMQFKDKGSF